MKKLSLILALLFLPALAGAEPLEPERQIETPKILTITRGFLPVCTDDQSVIQIASAANVSQEAFNRAIFAMVGAGRCEPIGAGIDMEIYRVDGPVARVTYHDGNTTVARSFPAFYLDYF